MHNGFRPLLCLSKNSIEIQRKLYLFTFTHTPQEKRADAVNQREDIIGFLRPTNSADINTK